MNNRTLFFSLGLIAAVLAGAYLYFTSGHSVSTDNAYLKFDKVTISSEVAGKIVAITVTTNQNVERGDPLITVDDSIYKIAVAQSEARLRTAESHIQSVRARYRTKQAELALAESNLDFADKEYRRELNLSKKHLTSEALIDGRKHDLDMAKENRSIIENELSQLLANLNGQVDAPLSMYSEVLEAQADLDRAKLELEHTRIIAPFSGFVSHLPNLGQHIVTGSPVLSLVADEKVWVEANFKETDLVNLQVDQPVDIRIDAYPGRQWKGRVESLSAATGAEFSVLPPQNSTGNWIKVVQRVPVRIKLQSNDGDPVLRAGMSAHVQIDTRLPGI